MSSIDLSQYANEERGEMTVAPSDEYNVRLVKFRRDNDGEPTLYYGEEQDKPYMMPLLEIIDHADSDGFNEFTFFLGFPNDEMTSKEKRKCLAKLDNFGKAFGIDFFDGNEIALEDIEGKATAAAIIVIKESEAYGEQNEVKQFLVNR